MQPVKNRNISYTPIRTYTEDREWHPNKHALLYFLEGFKLGSSGDQLNAIELGPYGCIVETHKGYSKRSESSVLNVDWFYVDINKIKVNRNRKNKQYDKDVHEMIMSYDPCVRYSSVNSDALEILELDHNGNKTYRLLTQDEYLFYMDLLFSGGVVKQKFPLHTRQKEVIDARKDFNENNKDADLIVNLESLHTRFGKDKTNYQGIKPETQVIFDLSGYFATWQITDEFDPLKDHPVYTRGKTKEFILEEIVDALRNNKRVWVMISTYNDENSDRIELLSLFKDANIEVIIDEADYQVWQQIGLLTKVITNVIS